MAQGTDKGTHADTAMAIDGKYHMALGPPARDASRATKASKQTKGKPVEGKGWGVLPGHADKGDLVEGKGWGVHHAHWPSDTGLQGKHTDQGKPVEGEGKGGEAEHKPKAKGCAQWKPKSGQTEQASEGKRQAHQRAIARTRRRRISLPA